MVDGTHAARCAQYAPAHKNTVHRAPSSSRRVPERDVRARSRSLALGGCATTLSPDEQQSVAGKTYVITGASSGFGRGVALKLAAMKANVVLAARRSEALQQVAPPA